MRKNSGFSLIEVMIFAVLIPATFMVVAVQLDYARKANEFAKKEGIKQGLRKYLDDSIDCSKTIEAFSGSCSANGSYINIKNSSDKDVLTEPEPNLNSMGISFPYKFFGWVNHNDGREIKKIYNLVRVKCQSFSRDDNGSTETWYTLTPEIAFAKSVGENNGASIHYTENNFTKAVNIPLSCLTLSEQAREDAEEFANQ